MLHQYIKKGEFMKVDFGKKLITLDGSIVRKSPNSDDPATLREISIESLMTMADDEKNLSGDDKVKRYYLALKIKDAQEIDITVEEAALLKKLIGRAYGPLIVGQAWEMLEG
jgi:hypothetical protein